MGAFQDKRILVTGATGLLGGNVARRLVEEGARVRGMVRNPAKAQWLVAEGIEIVQGDVVNADLVRRAMEGCQVVFHFAGILGEFKPWSEFRRVNVDGTRTVAEAAIDARVERFIHAGTVWVYGLNAGAGTNEECPRCPSGEPYCDTKIEGEEVVLKLHAERGLPAVIVQPSEVYGPRDETWTLGPVGLLKQGRLMLPNSGRGLIHPLYVADAVEGILVAAKRGKVGEAYILCGPEVLTIGEFFSHYARMLGRERIRSMPGRSMLAVAGLLEWFSGLSGQPPLFTRSSVRAVMMHASYDGSKAARELEFSPQTTVEEGMKNVQSWLASEGYLRPN